LQVDVDIKKCQLKLLEMKTNSLYTDNPCCAASSTRRIALLVMLNKTFALFLFLYVN